MDEAEKEHWWDVMRTLLHYQEFFETELGRRQLHLNRLSKRNTDKLPDMTFSKFELLHTAATDNQLLLEAMVEYHASHIYTDPPQYIIDYYTRLNQPQPVIATTNDQKPSAITPTSPASPISPSEFPIPPPSVQHHFSPQKAIGPSVSIQQQHRNQAILHSLYREWSMEGASERSQSFGILLQELQRLLPPSSLFEKRVLVPGCGLGRLPCEVSALGYSCEGNEFSAYMAVASNFLLNGIHREKSYSIFPWVSNICNIAKISDTIQPVLIPDITATTLLSGKDESSYPYPKFSMAAGNFVEIYSNEENEASFDAIVTCFFLDTAPVVLDYIETIHHILKPGGIWINLGPLLYHWVADLENNQDDRYQQSIELSYEELKAVILNYGFEYLQETWQDCDYTRCPSAMMSTVYHTVLFSVRKPARGVAAGI